MSELRRTAVSLGLAALLLLSMLPSFEARLAAATPSGNLAFGVLDSRASYGIPSYNNQQVQDAELSMLVSTGASCVRTDIGYAPWLTPTDPTTISLVDHIVGQIRSDQKCLIIADAGSESYRTTPIPWAAFKNAWVQRVETLAQRYQPDYYIVVKEPRWYIPMISDATTNPLVSSASDWVTLTQSLISAVQMVSPNTKIGVSVDPESLIDPKYSAEYTSYLQGVTQLSGLSFIGFDTYGSSDQTTTQAYLTQYGSGGKDVWVSEAWSTADGSALNGDPNQDATWMTSMYGFASSINAKFLVPFYTDDFSSYTWDTNPTDIVSNYNMRQPVYFAFQTLTRTPAITTSLSSPSIVVGGSAFDSAAISGATATAGGTVAYNYYSGNSCGGTATLVSQVPVTSGTVPNSASQTFNSAGSYSWNAAYSGDASNSAAISACEPLSVRQASSGITTAASPSAITLGSSASDTATLAGAVNPTGSITFNAYSDAACTASVFRSINALSGNGATSGSFTPASTGTYYWEASYSGDANNNAASTHCRDSGETLTVSQRTTTTSVSCSPLSVPVNVQTSCTATVADTAVGAAVTPTGSVTFGSSAAGTFSPGSCSVSGTGATATCKVSYTPSPGSEGRQTVTANYLGDNSHSGSASNFLLTVGTRSVSTTLSCAPPFDVFKPTTCTVTVTDTSPGTPIAPGGTATFSSSRPGSFSSTACTLSRSGTTASCSVTFRPIRTGFYVLKATYSGDSDHSGTTKSGVFTVR